MHEEVDDYGGEDEHDVVDLIEAIEEVSGEDINGDPIVYVLQKVLYSDKRHAIVEELAGLGAKVHTCSRNEDQLNQCLHEWEMKKFQVFGSVCDLVSPADREELINKVSSLFNGKLHIIVCFFSLSLFTAYLVVSILVTYKLWKNCPSKRYSSYNMCQLAHPLLKASGAGSIVFVSSIFGVVSINTGSIYSATKGNFSVCSLIMLQK
ncbi:tropinone reductase homolog At1g07440-like [Ziziphus jujuba]|uniref:Tropinone reductase homolog At1g07440-like n=1 Tax=Ziziphus jujuba TaxID=326968 RepID=A0ABM3ZUE0_ZIZJJ|nr:tropinone reductase homolog At1g07440-like [Ziziphus jujuba]